MGLRSILKWGFSGISVLFGLVLASNVDRLLAAHGWDKFLTQGVDSPIARFLPAIATGPQAAFVAIAVLAFTAGLWVDSALSKVSGRRTARQILGQDSLDLAGHMRRAADSIARQDANPLFAEGISLFIRYEKLGFDLPTLPEKFSTNERLRMMSQYFTMVGRLLFDGHNKEAGQAAKHLAASLPKEDFSSDRDRI